MEKELYNTLMLKNSCTMIHRVIYVEVKNVQTNK